MWTAAGAEPMSASRMERDLVFVKGLYQLVYGTLPIDPGGEEFFDKLRLVDEANAFRPRTWGRQEDLFRRPFG